MLKSKIALSSIATALFLLATGNASADTNRFAAVTINNNTPDVIVNFRYRWGNGAWSAFKNFKPKQAESFWFELDAKGRAPKFEMRIDEAIGAKPPRIVESYFLNWNAAPDRTPRFGRPYEVVRDRSDRDYVSVYEVVKSGGRAPRNPGGPASAGSTGKGPAGTNRFAVVTVNNNTPDVTVNFLYRWGNGAWTHLKNFKPGQAEYFWVELDSRGRAPNFEIKIDEAIGANPRVDKSYFLKWNAASDRGANFGHQNEIVRDHSDRDYVSVYDMGK